jgi:hypothetical protein
MPPIIALNIEAVSASEKSVNLYKTTCPTSHMPVIKKYYIYI